MCRIFAFKSILKSSVHSSLILAENALGKQSVNNPDGWGVCYYYDQIPHVIKSDRSAFDDQIFKKVSGVVSSQTVLAHIRKATKGNINILNTHPFQLGKWSFIHNGNIKNFSSNTIKSQLINLILKKYQPFILGETDSEVLFYILLSFLDNDFQNPGLNNHQKIELGVKAIINITGPIDYLKKGNKGNYFTFVLTDGQAIYSFQGGKPLYYSTHKKQCAERDHCSDYGEFCEKPAVSGNKIKHLLLSSTPIKFHTNQLNLNNIWYEVPPKTILSVDDNYKLKHSIISI